MKRTPVRCKSISMIEAQQGAESGKRTVKRLERKMQILDLC